MDANLKRKLARVVAILAVALGAGQLMQSLSHSGGQSQVVRNETIQKAKDVEPLVAGADPTLPSAQRLTAANIAFGGPTVPARPMASAIEVNLTIPAVPSEPIMEASTVDSCAATLDLANGVNAMIGLTLIAPCHQNERVVLKHAGLAITGKTTATGALFVDIPALQADGAVEVVFQDGSRVSNMISVPEISKFRRFAVQWQADDAFEIHAFEDELGYGGPGDVSAVSPHSPTAGLPAKGGFLSLLGDATTELPLLAQLYTFPSDPLAKVALVVEAPVTKGSCGREILAETLFSAGGRISIADLAAAMPGCDAIGDYLVLKNLVPDMNIASN